jgi:hypothetical protein
MSPSMVFGIEMENASKGILSRWNRKKKGKPNAVYPVSDAPHTQTPDRYAV